MRLGFHPGTIVITVRLQLSGGLALDGPELWRVDTGSCLLVPGLAADRSKASWTGVRRPGPGRPLTLQLYWNAFDSLRSPWRYSVTITVKDQAGALLPGRDGHVNPTVLPCDLGGESPHWDHRHIPIRIL